MGKLRKTRSRRRRHHRGGDESDEDKDVHVVGSDYIARTDPVYEDNGDGTYSVYGRNESKEKEKQDNAAYLRGKEDAVNGKSMDPAVTEHYHNFNSEPEMRGYAHRYVTGFMDQRKTNSPLEAIVPESASTPASKLESPGSKSKPTRKAPASAGSKRKHGRKTKRVRKNRRHSRK